MSKRIRVLPLALLLAFLVGLPAAAQTPLPQSVPNGLPSWAYNIPDKVQPPTAPVAGTIRMPGSTKEYDAAKAASNTNPPDWFPDEHPAAPRIVKGENAPAGTVCGTCHLMSGQGHPESADIAGLPAEYIVRQMNYFKSGARRDNERMGPIAQKVSVRQQRGPPSCFGSERRHGAYRPSHHRNTGGSIPNSESRSALALSGLRPSG
jgi:cytochrome c553